MDEADLAQMHRLAEDCADLADECVDLREVVAQLRALLADRDEQLERAQRALERRAPEMSHLARGRVRQPPRTYAVRLAPEQDELLWELALEPKDEDGDDPTALGRIQNIPRVLHTALARGLVELARDRDLAIPPALETLYQVGAAPRACLGRPIENVVPAASEDARSTVPP